MKYERVLEWCLCLRSNRVKIYVIEIHGQGILMSRRGCRDMKITGTQEEINWIMKALMNNCVQCPYQISCNEDANNDIKLHGEVKHSCESYLHKNISFAIENRKSNKA